MNFYTVQRRGVLVLVSVVLLTLLWSFEHALAEECGKSQTVILHTNDLHFDFNHREEFEEVVKYFRDNYESVLLLDAGDMFVRHRGRWPENSLDFYKTRTQFIIETMNEVGYDAATLGNHDVAYYETITRDSLRKADFPILGANVDVSTAQFDPPDSFTVFEIHGDKTLAVLGLTGGGYDNREGIDLKEYKETVEKNLYLAEEHDVFLLLTHLGVGADRALAERFGEIDAIVGGHSHTQLDPAEIINGVLVAQTGGNPHGIDPDRRQYLGVIRLIFENGELKDKKGEVLRLDSSGDVLEYLGLESSS